MSAGRDVGMALAAGLTAALAAALARSAPRWAGCRLEALDDTGLAHAHVRLVGHGALARIPKQSQMNLAPHANLAYQAACFERAARSGHAPRLLALLAPAPSLPRGALVVDEIVGRAASLPQDLAAIAVALARIHALPLPPAAERPPLLASADPLAALLAEIEGQGTFVPAAGLDAGAARAIGRELDRLRAVCRAAPRPARCLIAFDAHPGNFVVRADGTAVLVDLEKCRYGHAPLDVAHATLYTSTTWDLHSRSELTPAQVAQACADWSAALGAVAAPLQGWLLPLRRAMWLWSVTWCARWRCTAAADASALTAHVRERVDHYLSPAGVGRVLDEFDALGRLWPAQAA